MQLNAQREAGICQAVSGLLWAGQAQCPPSVVACFSVAYRSGFVVELGVILPVFFCSLLFDITSSFYTSKSVKVLSLQYVS